MPPHLHPRSAATSTLFAGTLVASFVVVAVPHIWPCPRLRKAHMDSEIVFDSEGRPMRRVRRVKSSAQIAQGDEIQSKEVQSQSTTSTVDKRNSSTTTKLQEEAETLRQLQAEAAAIEMENARRECPIPKPKGMIGRLLGLERTDGGTEGR